MGGTGLCGGVHSAQNSAQRQMTTQIPIGFCVHALVIGICFGECTQHISGGIILPMVSLFELTDIRKIVKFMN